MLGPDLGVSEREPGQCCCLWGSHHAALWRVGVARRGLHEADRYPSSAGLAKPDGQHGRTSSEIGTADCQLPSVHPAKRGAEWQRFPGHAQSIGHRQRSKMWPGAPLNEVWPDI